MGIYAGWWAQASLLLLTWNIINDLLGKQRPSQNILEIIIGEKHLRNQHNIAEAFKKYFSYIIDLTNNNGKEKKRLPNPPTHGNLDQVVGNFFFFSYEFKIFHYKRSNIYY